MRLLVKSTTLGFVPPHKYGASRTRRPTLKRGTHDFLRLLVARRSAGGGGSAAQQGGDELAVPLAAEVLARVLDEMSAAGVA